MLVKQRDQNCDDGIFKGEDRRIPKNLLCELRRCFPGLIVSGNGTGQKVFPNYGHPGVPVLPVSRLKRIAHGTGWL